MIQSPVEKPEPFTVLSLLKGDMSQFISHWARLKHSHSVKLRFMSTRSHLVIPTKTILLLFGLCAALCMICFIWMLQRLMQIVRCTSFTRKHREVTDCWVSTLSNLWSARKFVSGHQGVQLWESVTLRHAWSWLLLSRVNMLKCGFRSLMNLTCLDSCGVWFNYIPL